MKIAIQGTLGSYHHQAAENYFGKNSMELLELDSFKNLPKLFINPKLIMD